MNTKFVYVVVSNEKDIYLEQAWVSAYSARYYNPEATIILITDYETKECIVTTKRKGILSVINNIISVKFDSSYNNKQRSRWIKTNLRNLIDGDILFIDSDTIVTDSLAEIDNWNVNIGAVYDMHCRLINSPYSKKNIRVLEKIFGNQILKNETEYFNSGVLYIKDNEKTRNFFSKWHSNWEYGVKKGILTDQQSLFKTVNDLPQIISPISGEYNCQILGSIQYLHTAKIVHFFNGKAPDFNLNPFFGVEIYQSIKATGLINLEIQTKILNCKSLFATPSRIISGDDCLIFSSSIFILLRWLKKRCIYVYNFIKFISSGIVWIIKHTR